MAENAHFLLNKKEVSYWLQNPAAPNNYVHNYMYVNG